MGSEVPLLLVEDDRQLAAMLEQVLQGEGYAVDVALDGQRGLHLGLTRTYELIVLDRGLPALEGLDLLARLRAKGVLAPALVLSALANPADRVAGLDAGAEDYLSKPFDIDELAARLRSLRRRVHGPASPTLQVPGGTLELESRQVVRADGDELGLSEREAALLEVLARRPRQVFSRADLLVRAFPDVEDEGVVDTYVYYLRRKLGRSVVTTIRGSGYRLGEL